MNYNKLLDMATDVGYRLAVNGAEIFRVEESVTRILAAYGVQAQVFAIPNCLIVSAAAPDGTPITKMRRIRSNGTNINCVEQYSDLSRKICKETPDLDTAVQWIQETDAARLFYKTPAILLGYFLSAAGFAVFFGGGFAEFFVAGFCGLLTGVVLNWLNRFQVNPFFTTTAAAFLLAIVAYFFGCLGFRYNVDATVTGVLMILVPGLLFTNAMRDIIFGDTNSGVNRIVQVLLIAAAIALGTGAAWNLARSAWNLADAAAVSETNTVLQCIAAFIGCTGFLAVFNVHGAGSLLCSLGSFLVWLIYLVVLHLNGNELLGYFVAALFSAAYSEVMARIRKKPATAYLVVSIFPLLPGAGIYYAANYLVRGDIGQFASTASHTSAIAGTLAVGILLVSTVVRLWYSLKARKEQKTHC